MLNIYALFLTLSIGYAHLVTTMDEGFRFNEEPTSHQDLNDKHNEMNEKVQKHLDTMKKIENNVQQRGEGAQPNKSERNGLDNARKNIKNISDDYGIKLDVTSKPSSQDLQDTIAQKQQNERNALDQKNQEATVSQQNVSDEFGSELQNQTNTEFNKRMQGHQSIADVLDRMKEAEKLGKKGGNLNSFRKEIRDIAKESNIKLGDIQSLSSDDISGINTTIRNARTLENRIIEQNNQRRANRIQEFNNTGRVTVSLRDILGKTELTSLDEINDYYDTANARVRNDIEQQITAIKAISKPQELPTPTTTEPSTEPTSDTETNDPATEPGSVNISREPSMTEPIKPATTRQPYTPSETLPRNIDTALQKLDDIASRQERNNGVATTQMKAERGKLLREIRDTIGNDMIERRIENITNPETIKEILEPYYEEQDSLPTNQDTTVSFTNEEQQNINNSIDSARNTAVTDPEKALTMIDDLFNQLTDDKQEALPGLANIKSELEELKETIENNKDSGKKTVSFIDRIAEFFRNLFSNNAVKDLANGPETIVDAYQEFGLTYDEKTNQISAVTSDEQTTTLPQEQADQMMESFISAATGDDRVRLQKAYNSIKARETLETEFTNIKALPDDKRESKVEDLANQFLKNLRESGESSYTGSVHNRIEEFVTMANKALPDNKRLALDYSNDVDNAGNIRGNLKDMEFFVKDRSQRDGQYTHSHNNAPHNVREQQQNNIADAAKLLNISSDFSKTDANDIELAYEEQKRRTERKTDISADDKKTELQKLKDAYDLLSKSEQARTRDNNEARSAGEKLLDAVGESKRRARAQRLEQVAQEQARINAQFASSIPAESDLSVTDAYKQFNLSENASDSEVEKRYKALTTQNPGDSNELLEAYDKIRSARATKTMDTALESLSDLFTDEPTKVKNALKQFEEEIHQISTNPTLPDSIAARRQASPDQADEGTEMTEFNAN